MNTPYVEILPYYEAAHEFNQVLPDEKGPRHIVQVLPSDETAHEFIRVIPGEKPPQRAAPVAHHEWELHKEQTTKWWYQRGFSREEIQKLLQVDGLTVTTDQLWRKMKQWKLVRAAKGKGLGIPESAATEVDYSLHSDESTDSSLLDGQLVAAPESENSHFTMASHLQPAEHDPNVYKVGTIVAEAGPRDPKLNKQSIRMWLVVTPRTVSGFVDCIRVKSFGGRGIEGSLAAFCPLGFSTSVDDQRSRQRLIDAHAILHIQGSPVPKLPAGLTSNKLALAVEMGPDLPPSVLPKSSYALFTTPRSLSCKSNLVVVGHLTKFSTAVAEIYYKQMFEGSSSPEA